MVEDAEESWEWLIADQSAPWSIVSVGAKLSAVAWKHALLEPVHEPAFQAQLKQYESRFRGGEKYALFAALTCCVMWCRPLPSWASKELWRAYHQYCNGQLESWNDVFGKPFPGKRRKGISTKQKAVGVWAKVRQLHETKGYKLDDGLFEKVGKLFNIGTTTARNLYYDVQNIESPFTATKKAHIQSTIAIQQKRKLLRRRKK